MFLFIFSFPLLLLYILELYIESMHVLLWESFTSFNFELVISIGFSCLFLLDIIFKFNFKLYYYKNKIY